MSSSNENQRGSPIKMHSVVLIVDKMEMAKSEETMSEIHRLLGTFDGYSRW